ncbi:hypothetical protein [Microbacterium indicum]|uniref:hypothetical protein n=1 Tax=Microbacterium indicum TaxID=358100 RepID=UPI000403C547|nr:hypothetical protein [Microbacterium indicum]
MNAQTLISVAISVVAILVISFRQLAWRRFVPRKLVILPLFLLVCGVCLGAAAGAGALVSTAGALDVVLIVVQLALAVGAGLWMGRCVEIAPHDGALATRLRPAGLGIWFGMIAIRLGLDGVAHLIGAHLAGSIALILLMLGVAKGTQGVVIALRVRRAVPEPEPAAQYAR